MAGSRPAARAFIRPTLLLAGLALVTCCRFADASERIALPATWLMIALLVVLGWSCSRAVALGSSAITLLTWSGIETSRTEDWSQLVFGQAMRLLVALWLVIWMNRLRERLAESHRFARLDSLTGLSNRQALIEALDAELSRTRRFGRPFTLALFDCDGFKGINDRGGHFAGDMALRQIGVALRQHTRPYDCVGRLGGDEFLLVLSEVDHEQATLIAERLRAALRHFVERNHPSLTFSLGVVTFQMGDLDGISFASTLLGQTQPPRPFLYREFPGYGGQASLRMGDWKGVVQKLLPQNKQPGQPWKIELYDLKNDVAEAHDVAAIHPEVVERIDKLMRAQHTPSAEFPFPVLDRR